MLEALGLQVITSSGEAEKTCALLNSQGVCHLLSLVCFVGFAGCGGFLIFGGVGLGVGVGCGKRGDSGFGGFIKAI